MAPLRGKVMVLKNRRSFLKKSFLGTTCMLGSLTKLNASVTPLQTLKVVQTDLFPKEKIDNANAYEYLSIIFKHSRVSDEEKEFLKNGTKWLNEEAVKQYKKVYTKLPSEQRQKVLQTIAKESWGRSWIKTVLSYILEAVLGDPIYGINKKESGWRWLDYQTGLPQPREALL